MIFSLDNRVIKLGGAVMEGPYDYYFNVDLMIHEVILNAPSNIDHDEKRKVDHT
jgi:hypothetical protein